MSPTAGYLIETFVTLIAVVAIAAVVLVGARRLGIGAPTGPLELVGRLPLDARRVVYLVRVGEQVLVVGSSEAGLVKLSELPRGDLPAVIPPPERSFSAVLRRLATPPKPRPKEEPGAES